MGNTGVSRKGVIYDTESYQQQDSENWVIPGQVSGTSGTSGIGSNVGHLHSGYGGLGDYVTTATGTTLGGVYCTGCLRTDGTCGCALTTSPSYPWRLSDYTYTGTGLTIPASTEALERDLKTAQDKLAHLEKRLIGLEEKEGLAGLDNELHLAYQKRMEERLNVLEARLQVAERRKDHEAALKLAAEAVSEKLRRQVAEAQNPELTSGDVVLTKSPDGKPQKLIAVQPTRLTTVEKHPDGPDRAGNGNGERRLPLVIEDAWSCHNGKEFVAMPAALLEKQAKSVKSVEGANVISDLPVSHIATAMATFVATISAICGSYLALMMF